MPHDRQVFNAKLGELLYRALVAVRNQTYPPLGGVDTFRRDEVNDLADLLHNIPRYVVGHDDYAVDSFDQFRGAVVDHVRRFHPDIDPTDHEYVRLLDMDPATFLARYRDHRWDAPEPEPAAQMS